MRILILSNSPSQGYGYSVVFSKVAKELHDKGHEVYYLGMQTVSAPKRHPDGYMVLGIRFDAFCNDVLEDYLRVYNIECLITGLDLWMDCTKYIGEVVKKMGVTWICHVTINSTPMSPFLKQNIGNARWFISPSDFVNKSLLDAKALNVVKIPHGFDSSVFKPNLEIKNEMKKKLGVEGKFVYITVMRNKGMQKNYPALFAAYKILLMNDPEASKNTILLCIADPLEGDAMRLDVYREFAGLQDHVKFLYAKPSEDKSRLEATYEGDPKGMPHNANISFDPEEMAKIYNAADVFVSSSSGESFQLPAIEAQACGVPVIMPDNTTASELTFSGQTGLIANAPFEMFTPLVSSIRNVDSLSLAECMQSLFKNNELREKFRNNALMYSQLYDWKKILPIWTELIKHIEETDEGTLGI